MATAEEKAAADDRFAEALKASGARDPRDYYRDRLRELRERDAAAYREAVRYYEDRLIPTVARNDTDPLREWLEYGCFLARSFAAGRAVQVDATGLAEAYRPPVPGDALVLHIPESSRERPSVVGLPLEMSPAQRATYDLLVAGRRG
jgi:hypothetical protein